LQTGDKAVEGFANLHHASFDKLEACSGSREKRQPQIGVLIEGGGAEITHHHLPCDQGSRCVEALLPACSGRFAIEQRRKASKQEVGLIYGLHRTGNLSR
jgi:hypothetical protein